MENAINTLISFCISAAGKIIAAVLIYFIGRFIIKKLLVFFKKTKGYEHLDPTVRSFTDNFVKALLYIILVICIISVLGVPIASVITVLASAGVAVGLALQGALSNLAGGIMMLVTRPFAVGDYISDGTNAGTVKEINLFYTVLMTPDNCRITIPNGTMMNSSVIDYSASGQRRVDLTFVTAFDSDIERVQNDIMKVMKENSRILSDPEPFGRYEGENTQGMTFTVRAWCRSADYWDVYYDLKQKIREELQKDGIASARQNMVVEKGSSHEEGQAD
jgi:small conductance mechanosensitive channel